MCIITDKNNIIVSISLIRGVDMIPEEFNIYEYVGLGDFKVGNYYKPENDKTMNKQ